MGEENLSDNEVKVGDKKLNMNTTIQFNVKTLLILLSFMVSGIGFLWKEIKSSSESNKDQVSRLQEEVKAIKEEDLKTISIQLNQVDGKVQGIFMNLQRDVYSPNTSSTNQFITPENKVKPKSPSNVK